MRGVVTAATETAKQGIQELQVNEGSLSYRDSYALTGVASEARDVWTGEKRWRRHEHAGAELVLTVGVDRFQVQFDGSASRVTANSQVTVTGALELVGEYEWEAFDLTDTRADWLVQRVVNLPTGDLMVDLARPAISEGR